MRAATSSSAACWCMCAVRTPDIGPVEPWRWLDRRDPPAVWPARGFGHCGSRLFWPFTTQRGNRVGSFQARTGDRVGRFPTFDGDQVLGEGPLDAQRHNQGQDRRGRSLHFCRPLCAGRVRTARRGRATEAHKPTTPGSRATPSRRRRPMASTARARARSTSKVRASTLSGCLGGEVCGTVGRPAVARPPWDGAECRSSRAAVMRAFEQVCRTHSADPRQLSHARPGGRHPRGGFVGSGNPSPVGFGLTQPREPQPCQHWRRVERG